MINRNPPFHPPTPHPLHTHTPQKGVQKATRFSRVQKATRLPDFPVSNKQPDCPVSRKQPDFPRAQKATRFSPCPESNPIFPCPKSNRIILVVKLTSEKTRYFIHNAKCNALCDQKRLGNKTRKPNGSWTPLTGTPAALHWWRWRGDHLRYPSPDQRQVAFFPLRQREQRRSMVFHITSELLH